MTRGRNVHKPGPRSSSGNLMRQAKALPFEPKVIFENTECTIRLPELGLVSTGASYETAREALLDEVREYTELYLNDEDLRRDPTRRNHYRLVMYAKTADEKGMLDKLVFAPLNTEG